MNYSKVSFQLKRSTWQLCFYIGKNPNPKKTEIWICLCIMYWIHKVKLKYGMDPRSLELTILILKVVENYLLLQSVSMNNDILYVFADAWRGKWCIEHLFPRSMVIDYWKIIHKRLTIATMKSQILKLIVKMVWCQLTVCEKML